VGDSENAVIGKDIEQHVVRELTVGESEFARDYGDANEVALKRAVRDVKRASFDRDGRRFVDAHEIDAFKSNAFDADRERRFLEKRRVRTRVTVELDRQRYLLRDFVS